MMVKLLLFFILSRLLGNPILALIILLIVFYVLERRYIGLTPSILKPVKRSRRLSKLREELRLSPHQTSAKLEAGRILMERKQYREARELLRQVVEVMDDSADVRAELGICELKLGALEEGERLLLEALDMNPRVKYGEPYLRLAEAWADQNAARAIGYLQQFAAIQSSSCEAYYRLGQLYDRLGQKEEARKAYRETVELYRGLPKYKRRHERKWALLARFK